MPVVSAATGAALIAHLPAGQPRLALLLACYAMFGVSLFISLITITLLWGRLAFSRSRSCPSRSHAVDRARAARPVDHCRRPTRRRSPECHLGSVCGHPGRARVLYGVPVWGFAMIWLAIAAAITTRTARDHLPYSLTWWSFTFPVGTLVTGTSVLALATHADFLRCASVRAVCPAHRRLADSRDPHRPRRAQRQAVPPATRRSRDRRAHGRLRKAHVRIEPARTSNRASHEPRH